MPITQIFVIDKLFTPEHGSYIVSLYKTVREDADPSTHTQLDLHYGLALLNMQENEEASAVLNSLYDRIKEPHIHFYAICADIRVENGIYQSGMAGRRDTLADLLDQLDSYKKLKQYTQQELFLAALKMESFYHLGLSDKMYLEWAIEEFNSYSESTQNNTIIQYYYALCLELNGERCKAIKVYDRLDWKDDTAIAERYMICLILDEKPNEAVAVYNSLKQKSVRTEAIYLFALDRSEDETYIDELKKAVVLHGNSLLDFLQIAYYTDSKKPIKEIVIPILRKLISKESLNRLLIYQKIEIITFLAHCHEIELMETVLKSVEDVSKINNFVVGEIYKALFDIANREYLHEKRKFKRPDDFEAVDRIADKFLSFEITRKYFLQIKVLCAQAKQMPFSSLKYSKELFEITHDEEIAHSIIALLFDRKETNHAEYVPYLEVLEKSEKPGHCLVVACAMLVLGREDAAEYYAYKALYLLNGEDDYDVYRSYFSFYNYNLHRYHADVSARYVRRGVVVMLEEINPDGEPHRFEVCLDPETDLSDETNRSMGVEHLTPSNPDYIKLQGSGLRQILKLRGKSYQIIRIVPRERYGIEFIFHKIQEKPEIFRDVVWMISTQSIDEMIKQIKKLTDNTEQIKSLLSLYHFENNEAGLPIDVVAFGDYRRYIDAFKYLLYKKGEAFYAGVPIYESEEGQKYVPGLATLMLLSILGRIDVLEAYKNEIIIPESYIIFFQNEYSKAVRMDQVSSSTLYFIEDKPVIQESDKGISEIWEAILEFCHTCAVRKITDQERIDFEIADGLTGEYFITGLNLSTIHLDALILSKREKATFLCDDLFFRKLATWAGVRNLNIVSLIQHYIDPDFMVTFFKELSKTNYIYIPIRARNDKEFKEILENLMDGEKKQRFYSEIIQRFFEVRDRIFREILGDGVIDQMYTE